jgi:hypothetical protein
MGPRDARPNGTNPESSNGANFWIPGSREEARPGMTLEADGGHGAKARLCPPYDLDHLSHGPGAGG